MYLHTNVELNFPHHLNYVAALAYLVKCTQRIVHVKPFTFCAKKHQTLFYRSCGIQTPQMHVNLVDYEIWVIIKRRMTKIRSVRERGLTD